MSKNLYIAASEKEAGKSLIILGIMDFLAKHSNKIGFFRPIVRSNKVMDHHIKLVSERFKLGFEYEEMYGLASDEMADLFHSDDTDAIQAKVLNKYKMLERKCDFVLVEGSDFRTHLSAYEFAFNLKVANNLGCPIIGVVSGFDKTPTDISDSIQVMNSVMAEEKCIHVGTIINRANKKNIKEIEAVLNKYVPDNEIGFVIPELSILQKLTMRQIGEALNAKRIYGNEEGLNYDVNDFKVAAMNLEQVLKYLNEGSLIIMPGDRIDILAGLFLTLLSHNFPKIAGILLTGEFKPSQQIIRLLDDMNKLPITVFKVDKDTFTTAMDVSEIKPMLLPGNEQRLATALVHFESNVNIKKLTDKISIARSDVITPLMFEYELFERAKSDRKHIVLPESLDDRILMAADILLKRNVVDLTLLGNEDEILKKASIMRIRLDGVNIIDPYDNDLINEYAAEYFRLRKHKGISKQASFDLMYDVSYLGTMMVYKGHADGMVSGAAHTTQHTIRPAFEFIRTKQGVSIVSSSFLMCLEDRVLVYGDCAINPNPNAEQLADIAISSAHTATMFGIEPRIAMLSYSTGQSGKGLDVEKVREATEIVHKIRPDLKVEGPIQYDAAFDASVAKKKMPDSEVAGKATIYIFPDLNTGNNTYKAVQRSANAVAIGPVLQGLNKPVNDLSRGCLVKDIVNTVLITAIQAQD
ncbi:MAG: phosphate acetyltransferase [Bacteroidetes bacterium 4484_249]|nr:MAG: phosphate acetyltransferase [Bacteroidetes bacterium 4484_249]